MSIGNYEHVISPIEGGDQEDGEMQCGECVPEVKRELAGGDERKIKKLGDPRKPTQAEVDDH